MLTITEQERNDMVSSAEQVLMDKAWCSFKFLERGGDSWQIDLSLSIAYCNLLALEHYETGAFDTAEYFNVIDPDDFAELYSNINTVKTIRP